MIEKELIKLRDKANLVKSNTYQQIRAEQLNYIVENASTLNESIIKGMLLLIKKTDEWEDNYKQELE